MKKVIAFLLAVLYFVFTTFTFWQVNGENGLFGHTAHDSYESVVATTDDERKKVTNNDILADESLSGAPKHLTVSGKRNLPRASSVVLAFRNFLSFSTTGFHKWDIRSATPLLYHASIYLYNGVLRI
jgi:uncharacterized protein YxeA